MRSDRLNFFSTNPPHFDQVVQRVGIFECNIHVGPVICLMYSTILVGMLFCEASVFFSHPFC